VATKADLEKRASELELTVTRRDGKEGEPTVEDYQHAIGVAEGAILPDEAPTVTKTYEVVGPFAVAGYGTGETFDAEVQDGVIRVGDAALNEWALVEQGALRETSEGGEKDK
jgi:hypothetical protein